MADTPTAETEVLVVKKHVKYFRRVLNMLPTSVQSLDTSRMTLLFFAVSGLDLLGALDTISPEEKAQTIEWIYSQQVLPDKDATNIELCGFRGSGFLGVPFSNHESPATFSYDCSHVAMTYTAMAVLLILGDDLSRVNRAAVLQGVRRLQLDDGSFTSTAEGGENDMRFVFCASCVCFMLNDWSTFDKAKATDYIRRSQGYDHGIAQGPYLESHGGSTFCAIASLVLMGTLEEAFSPSQLEGLKKWCISRQQSGFQGRPNKPVDTCYSFWIGASLELLGCSSFIDREWNRGYVFSTQGDIVGGFAKWPDAHPDPMHTYLGLSGLSLNGQPELGSVCAALNISQRAADWLTELHSRT